MEKGREQGVLLLDHYDELADALKKSFRLAGFSGPVFVISGGGFLPDDVMSVYQWFSRESDAARPSASAGQSVSERSYALTHAGWTPGKARFFDQIECPEYWEISGSAASGEVKDLHHLRGKIFYSEEQGHRLVSDVDWLGENGMVAFTDHYDRQGYIYSRTVFNRSGKKFCRSWFDRRGRERIVENFVTGDIIVSGWGEGEKIRLFKGIPAMAAAMLREAGLEGSTFFYNSLSVPLFVTEELKRPTDTEGAGGGIGGRAGRGGIGGRRGNILFWQEGPRDDIPGNMRMILEGRSKTDLILVQNRESYDRLMELCTADGLLSPEASDPRRVPGAPECMLRPMGFAYDLRRKNRHSRNALICTNSDQIRDLDTMVAEFPDLTFHIAAVTEMSSRLMAFGKYPNVRLYPVARESKVRQLMDRCDIYLDINHGGEILSSVKEAFLSDQLILAFRNTMHRRALTGAENVFQEKEALCAALRQVADHPEKLDERLELQRRGAMAETAAAYRALIR